MTDIERLIAVLRRLADDGRDRTAQGYHSHEGAREARLLNDIADAIDPDGDTLPKRLERRYLGDAAP